MTKYCEKCAHEIRDGYCACEKLFIVDTDGRGKYSDLSIIATSPQDAEEKLLRLAGMSYDEFIEEYDYLGFIE